MFSYIDVKINEEYKSLTYINAVKFDLSRLYDINRENKYASF